MKKTLLATSILALSALNIFQMNKVSELNKEIEQGNHFITTDKVNIELVEVENGDYDIIIDAKDNTNVAPEFDVVSDRNYKHVYLVGKDKGRAKEHFEQYDYKFEWEE